MTINVAQGRTLFLPKENKRVAELTFNDLCEEAKGSTDYMALAQYCTTVIIREVP